MRVKTAGILIIAVLCLLDINADGQQMALAGQDKSLSENQASRPGDLASIKVPRPGMKNASRATAEERRARFNSLSRRKMLLQQHLTTISPESAEYQATETALGKIETDLRSLEAEMTESSPSAPAATAPRLSRLAPVANESESPAPVKPPAGSLLPQAQTAGATGPISNCNLVLATKGKGFTRFERAFCSVVGNIVSRKIDDGVADSGIILQDDFSELDLSLAGWFLLKKGRASFLLDAEEARTDKQVGSGPANSGTTSLTVKGGVPAVLGFAVENGAAVADRDGTTVTFRFNPVGTIQTLAGLGAFEGYDQDDATTRFLRKTSIGVSFDTDRGQEPGVLTANKQQLSAYSIRFEFVNERDLRNKKYQKLWENFFSKEAVNFLDVTIASLNALIAQDREKYLDPTLQTWFESTNTAVAAAGKDNAEEAATIAAKDQASRTLPEQKKLKDLTTAVTNEVQAALAERFNELPFNDLSDASVKALMDFANGYQEFSTAKKKVLDEIAKGKVLTLEYTNFREVNAPDLSNFRFIGATGPGGKIDLTGNASLTIFNKKPAGEGVSRIRDFQFSGQMDIPFKNVYGTFLLSGSYRYERLLENASTQAGTIMPDTKGDIHVGQLKLTVPLKGLGMKFPISVTFANRTELVKEREVRGNFGFTFDFDALLARFKPF